MSWSPEISPFSPTWSHGWQGKSTDSLGLGSSPSEQETRWAWGHPGPTCHEASGRPRGLLTASVAAETLGTCGKGSRPSQTRDCRVTGPEPAPSRRAYFTRQSSSTPSRLCPFSLPPPHPQHLTLCHLPPTTTYKLALSAPYSIVFPWQNSTHHNRPSLFRYLSHCNL